MDTKTLRRITIILALGFFIAALCLPAFNYTPPGSYKYSAGAVQGWFPFSFGWIAMMFLEPASVAWLANPFFLFAMHSFYVGRYTSSMWLSAASMFFALSFFPICWLQPLLIVFSGTGETINHPKPEVGFAAWMAAFLVLLVISGRLVSARLSANGDARFPFGR